MRFTTMRGRVLAMTSAVLMAASAIIPVRAAASSVPLQPPRFVTLKPGASDLVPMQVRVNVILVGYETSSVDLGRLRSLLPVESKPPIVSPLYYGLGEAVGVDIHYQYAVHPAGRSFDDSFFRHLVGSGDLRDPDYYQSFYNQQVHHTVTVGPKVRYIDATSTESWLEQAATRQLGISPADDTVFLINWYGRSDFQFHTYTTVGKPDPDTGVTDGKVWQLTHVRAWGGQSGRSWFYDLSAGPVFTDDSYDVDKASVHNLAPLDYRMPPIWDYGSTGYRPFDDLTGDLGKIVRYVAIDMLFTSAPIYDPEETLPRPDGSKQIAVDVFEGDPSISGLTQIHPAVIRAEHQALEPYFPISISVRDLPFAGEAKTAYDIGTYNISADGCWNEFGYQDAEFYCDYRDHYSAFFPAPGHNSVIPVLGYSVADEPGERVGYAGNAGDDLQTGAPAVVTEFDAPSFRTGNRSAGFTELTTHEVGHFVGLAHPHDGLDEEQRVIWDALGSFDFARTGDEAATPMSYLPGAPLEFSAFDRDNLARWHVGRLSFLADLDAGRILAEAPNGRAYALLHKADLELTGAMAATGLEQWMAAASLTAAAYADVQRADLAAGIPPASDFGGNELWRAAGSSASIQPAVRTAGGSTVPLYLPTTTQLHAKGAPTLVQCSMLDTCDVPGDGVGGDASPSGSRRASNESGAPVRPHRSP